MTRSSRFHPQLAILPLIGLAGGPSNLAALTGLPLRTVQRRKRTGLSVDEADRFAVAVGCHPSELWSCWTELVERDVSVPCPECPGSFVPFGRRKFCSTRCKQRAAGRSRRAQPGYRERQNAYLRGYREQARETARAYAQAYYRANRERLIRAAVERKRRAKKAAA